MTGLTSLALQLQRAGVRARTGTGSLSTIAVLSFTVTSWLALVVAGGTWMFYRRMTAPSPELLAFVEASSKDFQGGWILGMHFELALVACAFLVPAIISLTSNSAVLGASGREERLATLRLIGLSSGDVLKMTIWETLTQAVVGIAAGTVLSIVTAPAWSLLTFQTVPIGTWEVLLPWWGYPIVWAVLLILAVASAMVGLLRVSISPLGVARREMPKALKSWRAIAFLVVTVAGVLYLQMNPPSMGSPLSGIVIMALVLMTMILMVNAVAPYFIQVMAVIARAFPGTANYVAFRRIAVDAKSAWKRVSSMAFLSILVGVLATSPRKLGLPGSEFMVDDLANGMLITLGVGFTLMAMSTVLTQASAVFESASLSRALDRLGIPTGFHGRTSAWQTLAPLVLVSLFGAAFGAFVGLVVLSSPPDTLMVGTRLLESLTMLGIGFVLTALALVAVEPLRRRVIGAAVRRND